MNRLDIEWAYLRLANRFLAENVVLPEVYRSLVPVKGTGGAGGLSQLTIGNILLCLKRLQAAPLSDADQAELTELCKQIEQVRDRWRVNWERKARRERSDLLQPWLVYLEELAANTDRYSRSYPSQVRLRVIIYLLDEEIGRRQALGEDTVLDQQDRLLRSISSQGPFVWETDLAEGFQEKDCWFLFRSFG